MKVTAPSYTVRNCRRHKGSSKRISQPVKRGRRSPELHVQQYCHAGQHPFGRLLPRPQIERPHVGRSSLFDLVHWTFVRVSRLLFALDDGFDVHYRHCREQFFQRRFDDTTGQYVPTSAFQYQSVYHGAFPGSQSVQKQNSTKLRPRNNATIVYDPVRSRINGKMYTRSLT